MNPTNEQIQALKAAAEKIISEMVAIRNNGQCGRAIFTWGEFDALLAAHEADKALIAEQATRIAELREWNVGLAQESLDRQQRIAEMEARTVKLPATRLWAGVTECYEKYDVISAIRASGVEVSDD